MMFHFHRSKPSPCNNCTSQMSFMSLYVNGDKILNLCRLCMLEMITKLNQAGLKLAGGEHDPRFLCIRSDVKQ
jgi:hypothetical protein